MWKYLSIVLAVGILVIGGFYLFERYNHDKTRKELNNQVAELEGTIKETETAYSKLALLKDKLEIDNEELFKIIEDRNENIAVLSEINIKLRNRIIEITDATETIEDSEGNPVELGKECEECFKDKRFRVDFLHLTSDGLLFIEGYTLTNPSYVYIKTDWRKDLQLKLVLTKDDDAHFRIYVDSDSDIEPTELSLSVDPSVFKNKWFQKIAFGIALGAGPGVQTSVGSYYELVSSWTIGPFVTFQYDGIRFRTFYGAQALWFPFR